MTYWFAITRSIISLTIPLFVASVGTIASAAENSSDGASKQDLQDIIKFLKKNVVGQTLVRENTSTIDAGRVESVFRRALNVSKLDVTDGGFVLQVIGSIQQTNYDLDAQGKRRTDSQGRQEDRVIVSEIRIATSRSTGKAVGYMTFPTATSGASAVLKSVKAVRAELRGESLDFHLTTVGYDDGYSQGGTYRSISADDVWTFDLATGKLQLIEKTTTYPVDPVTGTKGPGEDSQTVSHVQ